MSGETEIFREFKPKVKIEKITKLVPARRVDNYYVHLDGEKFEFFNLLETLQAVRDFNVTITDQRMADALANNDIVSGGNSDIPSRFAEFGEDFLRQLEKEENKITLGLYGI